MRVDSRPDSCAADGKFQHRFDGRLGPPDGELKLPGKAAELLTEPQRGRIGQVSTADLDDLVPLLRLGGQDIVELLQAGISVRAIDIPTATWIAVGNVSFVLCPMLTWSLG